MISKGRSQACSSTCSTKLAPMSIFGTCELSGKHTLPSLLCTIAPFINRALTHSQLFWRCPLSPHPKQMSSVPDEKLFKGLLGGSELFPDLYPGPMFCTKANKGFSYRSIFTRPSIASSLAPHCLFTTSK